MVHGIKNALVTVTIRLDIPEDKVEQIVKRSGVGNYERALDAIHEAVVEDTPHYIGEHSSGDAEVEVTA